MTPGQEPERALARWALCRDRRGELVLGGLALPELARRFGTPLSVVDLNVVEERARSFRDVFRGGYAGSSEAVYPVRCNDLGELVDTLRGGDLALEVTTEFEMELALRVGTEPHRIVLNGVHKPAALLDRALGESVGFVVVDSLEELTLLEDRLRAVGVSRPPSVLLGVGGIGLPRAADPGAITSTRRGCPHGLDWRHGELGAALESLRSSPALRYRGLYLKMGGRQRDHRTVARTLRQLRGALDLARGLGLSTTHLFLGGGFGTTTSREFSPREMLLYQGRFVLPRVPGPSSASRLGDFAAAIDRAVRSLFGSHEATLPHLMVETGPHVTGPCQLLLVRVSHVKRRQGLAPWVVTDGGAGTVAFPLYYEIHEVVNCSRAEESPRTRVTIVGPVCYSTDWIYRNKDMPPIRQGDVLAVLDTGAYFSVLECNFGFLRPATVGLRGGAAHLLRRRETPEDLVRRDFLGTASS